MVSQSTQIKFLLHLSFSVGISMRTQGNPLDLNNLPAAEDHYTTTNKLNSQHYTSSSAAPPEQGEEEQVLYSSNSSSREKNSGCGGSELADGKDVDNNNSNNNSKVYECRFCSLKFCKSQALGGHMNRHRQERETESLNKARQLVLSNDLAPAHLSYVSSGQPFAHTSSSSNSIGGDASFRSMYPASSTTRLFPNSSSLPFNIPPPHQPPYMYTSPPMLSFPSPNDYFMGHVLSPNTPHSAPTNYTCIGAPVFTTNHRAPDSPMHNQDDGHNWSRR